MEDWQKDWMIILEKAKNDFEEFCDHLAITAENVAKDVSQAIEGLVVEVEDNLNQEVENFFQEIDDFVVQLLQPLIEQEEDFEETIFFEQDFSLEVDFDFDYPTLKPNAQKHSACIGCTNYHGKIYGGNLLVCAMHPYGWDDDYCPDWDGNLGK
jgi:hypothetical protein